MDPGTGPWYHGRTHTILSRRTRHCANRARVRRRTGRNHTPHAICNQRQTPIHNLTHVVRSVLIDSNSPMVLVLCPRIGLSLISSVCICRPNSCPKPQEYRRLERYVLNPICHDHPVRRCSPHPSAHGTRYKRPFPQHVPHRGPRRACRHHRNRSLHRDPHRCRDPLPLLRRLLSPHGHITNYLKP